jgi:hypothetical protein
MKSLRPAVVGLVETWLPATASPPRIKNYYVAAYHNFTSKRGGTLIYLRNDIVSRGVPVLMYTPTETTSSILAIEVRLPGLAPLVVAICYRSPSMKSADEWADFAVALQRCAYRTQPTLLLGDFNARHTNWSDNSTTRSGRILDALLAEANVSVLNPILAHGTPTYPSSGSIIDLAITNRPEWVLSLVIPTLLTLLPDSDHAGLILTLRNAICLMPDAPRKHWKWDMRRMSRALFGVMAERKFADFNPQGEATPRFTAQPQVERERAQHLVDVASEDLHHRLSHVMEACIPVKWVKHQSNQAADDLPLHLQKLHTHYRRAKRQYFRDKHNHRKRLAWKVYRGLWRTQLKAFRRQRWQHLVSQIEDTTARGATRINFKAFNRTLPGDSHPPPCFSAPNGRLPGSIQEALDNASCQLAKRYKKRGWSNLQADVDMLMSFLSYHFEPDGDTDGDFTMKDIIEAARATPRGKAAGPDNIPGEVLCMEDKHLLEALLKLVNLSWRVGAIPKRWKQAKVITIYKGQGDRCNMDNYRPISITSVIARLFERMVLGRLKKKILPRIHHHQFGFIPGKSTDDAILQLITAIQHALTHRSFLPVAYLDILKAFDSVWIEGLLYILRMDFNVKGHLFQWCRGILTDREFCLVYLSLQSCWHTMETGVAQGTVVGPLLYLAFINRIFSAIYSHDSKGKPHTYLGLFADDIVLLPTQHGRRGVKHLRNALDRLTTYSERWKFNFNIDKSAVVVHTNARDDPEIAPFLLQETALPFKTKYKYLGIIMNQRLRFDDHFNHVTMKMSRMAGLINRCIAKENPRSFKTVRTLVRTFMITILSYGLAFTRYTQTQLAALDQLMAKPLRRGLGLPLAAAATAVLTESHIPRTADLRAMTLLKFFQRCGALRRSHPSHHLLTTATAVSKTPQRHLLTYADEAASFGLFYFQFLQYSTFAAASICSKLNWLTETDSQHLKLLHRDTPAALPAYLEMEDRRTAILRARLRFNKALLNESLHSRQLTSSPFCPEIACRHQVESPEHLLLHCPRFEHLRFNMMIVFASINVQMCARLLLGEVGDLPHSLRRIVLEISGRYLHQIQKIRNF